MRPACPISTAQTRSQQPCSASWLTTAVLRKESHPRRHFPALRGEDSPAILMIEPRTTPIDSLMVSPDHSGYSLKRSWILFLRRKLKPHGERESALRCNALSKSHRLFNPALLSRHPAPPVIEGTAQRTHAIAQKVYRHLFWEHSLRPCSHLVSIC